MMIGHFAVRVILKSLIYFNNNNNNNSYMMRWNCEKVYIVKWQTYGRINVKQKSET